MKKQAHTTLDIFLDRTKKAAYDEGYKQGFSDGYEDGLMQDVRDE